MIKELHSKYKAVIVIPVYKTVLNENEVKSLKQCFNTLNSFHMSFVCSKSFLFDNYLDYISANIHYSVNRFDDEYFTSIKAYNKLLLSLNFYRRFNYYDFMLIYQLDAWVFKNELDYWCAKGFSYIGAPWFEGWNLAKKESKPIGVGNGGFSLRNIEHHIKALSVFRNFVMPEYYLRQFLKNKTLNGLKLLLKNMVYHNNPYYKYHPQNEDIFWGRIAPSILKDFTVPGFRTALQFSVEVNPSIYVKQDDLPFGCHAWEKFEPDFWKQLMEG